MIASFRTIRNLTFVSPYYVAGLIYPLPNYIHGNLYLIVDLDLLEPPK